MTFTILLEVSGTVLLKYATTDPRMYVAAYALYFSGLGMFSMTLRTVPLSIAYATWCTFGTIGVVLASQVLFNESIDTGKLLCIVASIPLVAGMYVM